MVSNIALLKSQNNNAVELVLLYLFQNSTLYSLTQKHAHSFCWRVSL